MKTETRKVAYAVVLAAIGVALGTFSIPVLTARVLPAQHFINVVGAVVLGPWWAAGIALVVGIIRNVMGTGTLFAFPGGMIGALIAGFVYRYTRNIYAAALGEIVGTGFIAAVVSTLLVAPFMGRSLGVFALVPAFFGSTLAGSILGVIALKLLERAEIIDLKPQVKAGN